MILYRIEATSTSIVANSSNFFNGQAAQNIAQSGVNMALTQISADRKWRTGFSLMELLGGKVIVTATDTAWFSRPVIRVTSTGIVNYHQSTEYRATSTAFLPRITVPVAVKGLLTTDRPTSLEGNPIVDARDHTINGVLVPNQGTYGVWTTGTLSPAGTPTIGGTVLGADIPPTNPYLPIVNATGQSWPTYPTTPDSVLGGASYGFPEGTLKSVAQSGGGNQYVTDPGSLRYPLKGVTYVELPSGGTFANTDITGSGILIVHNSARNAVLKDCLLNFKGLVLIDDMFKSADIPHITPPVFIGAIFAMTPNASAILRCGNSDGSMIYSSEAIRASITRIYSSSNGSAANVLAWWE